MPSKNPKNHRTRFQPQAPVYLAKQSISVRLPEDIDPLIRSLPNRSEKLRQWIVEGWLREQACQQNSNAVNLQPNLLSSSDKKPKK